MWLEFTSSCLLRIFHFAIYWFERWERIELVSGTDFLNLIYGDGVGDGRIRGTRVLSSKESPD